MNDLYIARHFRAEVARRRPAEVIRAVPLERPQTPHLTVFQARVAAAGSLAAMALTLVAVLAFKAAGQLLVAVGLGVVALVWLAVGAVCARHSDQLRGVSAGQDGVR